MEKIWLTGQGVIFQNKEMFYNVTFEEINFNLSIYHEFNQAHVRLSRKELIRLREAINKVIPESEKIGDSLQ